jgi:hypothetical protein
MSCIPLLASYYSVMLSFSFSIHSFSVIHSFSFTQAFSYLLLLRHTYTAGYCYYVVYRFSFSIALAF